MEKKLDLIALYPLVKEIMADPKEPVAQHVLNKRFIDNKGLMELHERALVAEKMAVIVENQDGVSCAFEKISNIHCHDSGFSCNQCFRKNLRKIAIVELQKEGINLETP